MEPNETRLRVVVSRNARLEPDNGLSCRVDCICVQPLGRHVYTTLNWS